MTRDDFYQSTDFSPNLSYYTDPANGKIETDANGNPIYMEYSTRMADLLTPFYSTPGIGYQWVKAKIQELEALSTPTDMQTFQLEQLKELKSKLIQFANNASDIRIYNDLLARYSFLNIPGFDYIDPGFNSLGIRFVYALLKGNIAYFHVSKFYMSAYLDNSENEKSLDMSNPVTKNHIQQMKQVWQAWFDAVQQLHKGGTLKGLELTASFPLDMLTDSLRGFGVQASATFNKSDITILDPESANSVGTGPISLPGLSKRVYNFTAYYERSGFEARVSQRRRSDFIGEIGNFNGNRTLRYVVGENVTDAQVSYTFSDSSSLRGLTLLLQGSNLTNEPYRTYAGSKDRPLEYIEWGRTYMLGVNYKF